MVISPKLELPESVQDTVASFERYVDSELFRRHNPAILDEDTGQQLGTYVDFVSIGSIKSPIIRLLTKLYRDKGWGVTAERVWNQAQTWGCVRMHFVSA